MLKAFEIFSLRKFNILDEVVDRSLVVISGDRPSPILWFRSRRIGRLVSRFIWKFVVAFSSFWI